MIRLLLLLFLFIIFSASIIGRINQEKRIKSFFVTNSIIKTGELVTFSIHELAKYIKKYDENKDKVFLIEYKDNEYLELNANDSIQELKKKLGNIQNLLIRERYISSNKPAVNDYVISIMHDIWVDYAHIKNYEGVFWRQMYSRLKSEEISNSTYRAIYRQFFKIKCNIEEFKL